MLVSFDPWGSKDFGGAGNVADDLTEGTQADSVAGGTAYELVLPGQ